MSQPSTPAGRALHKAEIFDLTIAEDRRRLAQAIEAEARAEGRREAVDRILELLSLFTDDAHPSITHIRDIVLESVAGLNASEPPA